MTRLDFKSVKNRSRLQLTLISAHKYHLKADPKQTQNIKSRTEVLIPLQNHTSISNYIRTWTHSKSSIESVKLFIFSSDTDFFSSRSKVFHILHQLLSYLERTMKCWSTFNKHDFRKRLRWKYVERKRGHLTLLCYDHQVTIEKDYRPF